MDRRREAEFIENPRRYVVVYGFSLHAGRLRFLSFGFGDLATA
jgi:hypothetical protein